jgi:outer membrane protein assembly factor BamB
MSQRCRSWISLPVLLLTITAVDAANWPRFRGPNGTGVAADKDIPVKWDEQSGILWKVALPGRGNSSPIVWGKRLFAQTASKDGKERMLLCIDVTDGKTLWSRTVPGNMGRTHLKNTLASSTPATDGQRVYAAFWDGKDVAMTAYDFDGNLLWRRDLGKFVSQHGAGASPVVYGDKVLFANDQDGLAVLLALDARTGQTAWDVPRKAHRACYSAPFLLEEPGSPPEIVVAGTGGITGYNPDTGKVNWHWNWVFDRMALRATGSPIFAHGMIFACTGDGDGSRHMVAVRLERNGSGTHPILAWQNKRAFPYVPTLLTHGEHLYFVNDKGIAACYVAKTGELVWSERLEGTLTSSPILIDGKIYAAMEDGDVYVLAAEPTFRVLAKNSLGEPVIATPAVADHRLFIRGQEHLFCIGKMQSATR